MSRRLSDAFSSELTRRTFLRTSAMAAVTSSMSSSLFADDAAGAIDAHVHVWTPDTESYPLAEGYTKQDMKPPSFTPEELFAHSRPNGVSRIVLIQMSFYKFDNSYMLDMMKKHPGVFGGVAIVDETQPDVCQRMRDLAKRGVRGFRLYTNKKNAESWETSDGMKAMWRCAADEGLAMCLLADPDALPAVERMRKHFPKTRVVIDHFARIGVSGEIHQSDLDQLCRLAENDETYVKTSAFYALGKKEPPYLDLGPMIQRLKATYGPERLMWATDCPFQVQNEHTYKASIELIRDRLDFLSATDKDWMLRRTAEKVFFS